MYLYVVQNEVGRVKIGVTEDLKVRFRTLETSSGLELVKKFYVEEKNKEELERRMHLFFKEYRTLGEWFNIDLGSVLKRLTKEGYQIKIYHDQLETRTVIEMIEDYNKLSEEDKRVFLNSISRSLNEYNITKNTTEIENEISEHIEKKCVPVAGGYASILSLYKSYKEEKKSNISITKFGKIVLNLGYVRKKRVIRENDTKKTVSSICGFELL